jgi:uncharacterized protein YacL
VTAAGALPRLLAIRGDGSLLGSVRLVKLPAPGFGANGVSIDLVLRFIGGILAGVTAGVTTSQVVPALLDPAEPQVRILLLTFSIAAAAFAVGFTITPYITIVPFFWFRERVLHASATDYLVGGVGLVIGLFCGNLLQAPLSSLPGNLGNWLPIAASALFAYFGVITMVQHKRGILELFGGARESVRGRVLAGGGDRVLVDTSAIIDGRIADVAQTGFLFCTLVVPRFVLGELQQVADSADANKRARGRRGLDVLEQLQKNSLAPVEIVDLEVEGPLDVDSKLVRLARSRDWSLLTNDYNLNRVAALQGITVLNINDLANALKATCIPGDIIRLRIIHPGKDSGQGVGYLADGTMVVVEGASRLVGEESDIVVTRAIQTAAGRIIFGRLKDQSNGHTSS